LDGVDVDTEVVVGMPETSVKGLTPLAFNEIAGANACRNQPEQGYGLAPQPEHPHANDLKVASCWEKKYERGPQARVSH
jgi:hypothetical protein